MVATRKSNEQGSKLTAQEKENASLAALKPKEKTTKLQEQAVEILKEINTVFGKCGKVAITAVASTVPFSFTSGRLVSVTHWLS